MFNLLPYDRFDFIAGRWAAAGAKDLIIYGIKAIKEELIHYNKKSSLYILTEFSFDVFDTKKYDYYVDVLKKAKDIFDDESGWDVGFGSKNWSDIAAALLNILIAYRDYKQTINDTDEQEAAIKKLLVAMNIFDGLAHNTGTIFTKLVNQQSQKIRGIHPAKELKGIERLRDISESDNPYDVLKDIEKNLDIKLPYKDIFSRMKMNPEYWENREEQIQEHLINVKQRKKRKMIISDFINMINNRIVLVKHKVHALKTINNVIKRVGSRLLTKNVAIEVNMKTMDLYQDIANPNLGILRVAPINLLRRDQLKYEQAAKRSLDSYIKNIEDLVKNAYDIMEEDRVGVLRVITNTIKNCPQRNKSVGA